MSRLIAPSLGEVFASEAMRRPERPALLWNERPMSFGRLASAVDSRARDLASEVRAGAIVALVMESTPAIVSTTLAAWRAGIAIAPLDPRPGPADLTAALLAIRPAAILAHPEHVDATREAIRAAGGNPRLLVSVGSRLVPHEGRRPTAAVGRAAGRPELGPGSLDGLAFVAMPPAGEGSGERAPVELGHVNVLASALRTGVARGYGPDDATLVTLPLWDPGVLVSDVLARLLAGGSVALRHRAADGRDDLLEALEQHRITDVSLAPGAASALLESKTVPLRVRRCVRKLLVPSNSLPHTVRRALSDRFPESEFIESWGKLETTGPCLTARGGLVFRKPDALGVPHPGIVLSVLDREDRARRRGEAGEIACRGAIVMRGYYRDERRTRAALQGGWYRTGELGVVDGDGDLIWMGPRETAASRRPAAAGERRRRG